MGSRIIEILKNILIFWAFFKGKIYHFPSKTIINAKQGFEGSLISRNVELSPQKPLKWSCDLQGWSVEEQYINRARSESRLTTMTSFETNLKKD